jgi:hypothetical protein
MLRPRSGCRDLPFCPERYGKLLHTRKCIAESSRARIDYLLEESNRHYMPTMEHLKADLALAEIDFLDRKGRRLDFHSLNTKLFDTVISID